MRLTLVIPQLLALDNASLNATPILARLVGFAGAPTTEVSGLDHAVLAAVDAPIDTPIAPLAALGAGFDPGERFVLRGDPVALVAGREDVLMTGRVDDLTNEEAAALVATLNSHFASDELVFHAPRNDAWFITVPDVQRLETTPLPAVQGATYPHQPRGDDAAQWRRWLSEMQMLLHPHPVNVERERCGRALVTGIWVSGAGTMPGTRAVLDATPFIADTRDGDVLRGLAKRAQVSWSPPPPRFSGLPATKAAMMVLLPLSGSETFASIVETWLAPALAALEHGEITSLALIADRGSSAFTWRASRPSLLARARARFESRLFAPVPDA